MAFNLEITRHDSTICSDMVIGFFDQCFKGWILEISPFGAHVFFIGMKTMFPIGQKTGRDDGRVMSPVFKESATLFKQMA